MNSKVDAFIQRAKQWKEEYSRLRKIVQASGLTEELKWGVPCYTLKGKNVVLIHGFKEYCALLFVKGALLKDPENLLIQQTENVQAARQIRFNNSAEIIKQEPAIMALLKDAIEIEKAGKKIEMKKTAEFAMPEEFHLKLKADPSLKKAFQSLTPGRQRAYLLHFSSAKLAKTRESRIEKCIPLIRKGKGLGEI